MQNPSHFLTWYDSYSQEAFVKNERRLVVLSGTESWALSLLSSIKDLSLSSREDKRLPLIKNNKSTLTYGESSVFLANVDKKRFRDKLGTESDFIIFIDNPFTIDAFAALSGTLKAGGLLFLITPSFEHSKDSAFFKRFTSLVQNIPNHTVITEYENTDLKKINYESETTRDDAISSTNESKQLIAPSPLGCINQEQFKAVQAIEKVVTGHRKRPLVLTADRGRGKSSALAIACAHLMQVHENDAFEIIISAPDLQSLDVFYRQLNHSLTTNNGEESSQVKNDNDGHGIEKPSAETQQECSIKKGSGKQGNVKQGSGKQGTVNEKTVSYGKARLSFMAIDQLIKQPIKCNLLLVDEASGIPIYLLEALLMHYHRLIFSSTVHGYEGAGRGFTIKFQKILDNVCPQWNKLHLKQPIRWREGDPLEKLIFDTCLLNAELPLIPKFEAASNTVNIEQLIFKVISATELLADEALLRQVFAVLVTAHYQTKPSDLQLLLDNPKVELACLFFTVNGEIHLVAVSLLMHEGESINNENVIDIKNAKRRLPNHFLPQSLLIHCGFDSAFGFNYLRIMRIAVHPELHQKGFGSVFLEKIESFATEQGKDFIGASFGANCDLLAFWFKANYSISRVGFTKDKASGEYSALVIKGLNTQGRKQQEIFKTDFYRSFDYLILDEYKALSTSLIRLVLSHNTVENLTELSELDQLNVDAFAIGHRLFSSCAYSLYMWIKHELVKTSPQYAIRYACKHKECEPIELALIARLIQRHEVIDVCQQYGYTGKKMLNNKMKAFVSTRLEAGR